MNVIEKLKLPTTWAGFGILWLAFGPKFIPWEAIVQAGTAIAALLAIILNHKETP